MTLTVAERNSLTQGSVPALWFEMDLLLVCFTAKWCGPCSRIPPMLEALEKAYPEHGRSITLDVDDYHLFAHNCGIQAIPSICVYVRGILTHVLKGSVIDLEMLKRVVTGEHFSTKGKLQTNISKITHTVGINKATYLITAELTTILPNATDIVDFCVKNKIALNMIIGYGEVYITQQGELHCSTIPNNSFSKVSRIDEDMLVALLTGAPLKHEEETKGPTHF
jgi:thioredoxin 1